jgi:hypothetical protein
VEGVSPQLLVKTPATFTGLRQIEGQNPDPVVVVELPDKGGTLEVSYSPTKHVLTNPGSISQAMKGWVETQRGLPLETEQRPAPEPLFIEQPKRPGRGDTVARKKLQKKLLDIKFTISKHVRIDYAHG